MKLAETVYESFNTPHKYNTYEGTKLINKAERILLSTSKDYKSYPKETKAALDSLLYFYSRADLNSGKLSNLQLIVDKFKNILIL